MEFAPGAIRLEDIVSGTLLAGIIPAPRFRRFDGSAQNAALVTVTAPGVTIATLDVGNVVAGDRILVDVEVLITKGATGGDTTLTVLKNAGTADILGVHDLAGFDVTLDGVAANGNPIIKITGMLKVTVGGTLTLGLFGQSLGSNSAVQAGDGEIFAWVIPGS